MHLALVAWLLVSYAQAAPDANLARLAGVWQGAGTVLNQPARIEMAWTPTLDGRFMKLTFVNHMGRAEPRQRFEGHAYYRTAGDDRYRGTWFDSSGAVRPIDARWQADALVSTWGTPDTEEGETTYRLLDASTMEIVDRVKGKNGGWREFGRSTVSRR